MTERSAPLSYLRKASIAYTLLTLANIVAVVYALMSFGRDGSGSGVIPIAIGAFIFAYACAVFAARFVYQEGGVSRTLIGFLVPVYNLYVPFQVRADTAKFLKHSGLRVGSFGVSPASFKQLAKARSESPVHWMREEFFKYLDGPEFPKFCERLAPGAGSAGVEALGAAYRLLVYDGQPVIGATVMRNVVLNQKDEAAPALIMGSFDFTQSGWRRVVDVMTTMSDDDADPSVQSARDKILADEGYKPFRRRRLSEEIVRGADIFLFDELMRSSDLTEVTFDGESHPNPITVLLAMSGEDGPSAVMPRHIAAEAMRRMMSASKPPPLPKA